MISHNHFFYKMLKKYIPVLTIEKISETENLLAYRDKLRNELYMIPKIYFLSQEVLEDIPRDVAKKYQKNYADFNNKISIIKDQINIFSQEATNKMMPYELSFKAVQRLWMARRRFAFEQGNLLQIPPTFQDWKRYICAAWNYFNVQNKTLPILWFYRFKYYFQILFNKNVDTVKAQYLQPKLRAN